ncbi:unnamed protein product [Rotaria socialis]|nr:unnamed protein product [Rotaria socialis]CAF3393731.1 unnamed protein product [Rotaria socialis]CAF3422806.1 unnamed protein product [Rotaria socialis]CAF3630632.1 unnamed protein product [Rotaria socialis]CAF4391586.1 unnamed protein product [Rotaria socialis]
MVELLTKQQIRNAAQRQFNGVKEGEKVTKKMAYEMLEKSFPDESPSRLHQLAQEADKDSTHEVILENFMVIVDFLLNEEKQPNDDEFPDDEEIDQHIQAQIEHYDDLIRP